jgi:hypothetical protein
MRGWGKREHSKLKIVEMQSREDLDAHGESFTTVCRTLGASMHTKTSKMNLNKQQYKFLLPQNETIFEHDTSRCEIKL